MNTVIRDFLYISKYYGKTIEIKLEKRSFFASWEEYHMGFLMWFFFKERIEFNHFYTKPKFLDNVQIIYADYT